MGLMVEVEEGLVELDIRALWCCCFMPGWKAPPYGHGFVSGDIVVQKQERKYLKRLAPSWKQNIVMMNFVLIEQAVLRWRADIYSLTTQGVFTCKPHLYERRFPFLCVLLCRNHGRISTHTGEVLKWGSGAEMRTDCWNFLFGDVAANMMHCWNCWKTQSRDRWVLPGYLVSPNCRFVWVWE